MEKPKELWIRKLKEHENAYVYIYKKDLFWLLLVAGIIVFAIVANILLQTDMPRLQHAIADEIVKEKYAVAIWIPILFVGIILQTAIALLTNRTIKLLAGFVLGSVALIWCSLVGVIAGSDVHVALGVLFCLVIAFIIGFMSGEDE